ncbi:uncharacterized protein LOC129573094, partial [Sitodiplosis mosellana]|uniref:uncharacterized protein LOC129573094 n=1 Tax=Sitodiplosis mosellana TaxID=263140 RepID=UPI002443BBAC
RLQSNASHVLLRSVEPSISGKFSCEVSADAPSFHTEIADAPLEVVELPKQLPVITGIQPRYRQGDAIRGNCTSFNSKPVANLTWMINDVAATWNVLRLHTPIKNLTTNLETTTLELNLLAANNYFNNSRGRLKLKCLAKIHNIYEEAAERVVE